MLYKRLERNLIHLKVVDSTNQFASELLKSTTVLSGTTILAEKQQKGRGQRTALWTSEEGKNLTMSTIFFPEIDVKHSFYLNIAVSLAVRKTLSDLKIPAKIKWPNDILVNEKKICGILIENVLSGSKIQSSVIGVGLNVNQKEFGELSGTSIANEINSEPDLMDVFDQYFAYLDFYVNLLLDSNFKLLKDRYYENLLGLNEIRQFEDHSGEFAGTIVGVHENGRLQVSVSGEIRSYDLKEVKFL
ncbi:MAG: biotin--[acetyl-CoA-carboxylase] ligase [Crocinitomicaceae bacterium]